MPYKIASAVLGLFACIGLAISLFVNFEHLATRVFCLSFYALLPALGAYWVWRKQRFGMLVTALFFAFQSIRYISHDSFLPHIAPISLSFTLGDFSSGSGYFIDVFAIGMLAFLLVLCARVKPTS